MGCAAVLGELRLALGEYLGLLDDNEYKFVWVTSRPMFEIAEDGSLQAAHHRSLCLILPLPMKLGKIH